MASGKADSNGGAVQCGAAIAFASVACLVGLPTCSITISFNGAVSSTGLGIGFSIPATALSSKTDNFTNSCVAETGAPTACTPSSSPPPPEGQNAWAWSTSSCSWILIPCTQCNSPILIDTNGAGFQLSSAANGVNFDFTGTGKLIRIAWPQLGSSNGWLALDRNHNGLIDDATELFGNITAQPPSEHPNGFLALAVFDTVAEGGNADGIIDTHDKIWPQLKVWIDSNHDGISQPGELHTLDELGIHSINLNYTRTPFTDAYGNKFRYKGSLNPDPGDKVDRVIYDVFLTTTP